jgi:UDP-N-acetylmuramoyl-L-alanyl-D-glutamate--2,6-diaminopimelate ligase
MKTANLKRETKIQTRKVQMITPLDGLLQSETAPGKVTCDSRAVEAGDIFVAVRGVQVDGHDFVADAVQKGAAAVVVEREALVPAEVKQICVADSAEALGYLAQKLRGDPAAQLMMLGVTGTNGKTTVAYLVRSILRAEGMGCGVAGTVEYDVGDGKVVKANNTTPDAVQLADLMMRMRENGLTAAVMECSSHGLEQKRTAGIPFRAAAFTNLSGDHLDYHGTVEAYRAAKCKLFEGLDQDAIAVLNGEDPVSDFYAQRTDARVLRFGIGDGFEIAAKVEAKGIWGSEFTLRLFDRKITVQTGLVGEHNIYNCLTAAGLARAAGASLGAIAEGIHRLCEVPGRLERIEHPHDFTVLVDYSHTDDALQHALATVKELAQREVIVVFGCGGNRDRTKRPRMAKVAEQWADQIVVTDDNPRLEDPDQIRAEIQAGFSSAGSRKVCEIPGRREAIGNAIRRARAGDVVLIAGKGHEDYQIVGHEKLWFDDRVEAKQAIEKLKIKN